MRSYEISSPRAAELYFTQSFVGDVASFLTALRREFAAVRRSVRAARRIRASAKPKAGTFDRLDAWFARQDQKARERYLARSRDVFELERRMNAIDRGYATRYY